jgi:trimeric autotransporter adhesin
MKWLVTIAALLLLSVFASNALAVTPAGTIIGNQATATYQDSTGTARTSTSNLVQTTVSQVKSFTLTAAGAKTGTPGQTVYYPHTITNTGNGTDTYALNAATAGGTVTQTGLTYYVDANGDGVPDNFTPITSSGAIAAGTQFSFVVAASIPNTATAGQTGTVTVSATDTGTTTNTNIDTTTVANSVVNVTKSLSSTSGAAGATGITVTLSYSNAGTSPATNVVLTDALPTGMTYTAGTGRWSVSGATALTDAAAGDPTGIAYDFGATTAGAVTATIATVAAGTSGTVSFQISIGAALAPTTAANQTLTTNTASFSSTQQTTATNTNSVVYRVLQTASLTAAGQTVASAAQGATLSFSNIITNSGNGTDSFDITYPAVGSAGNTFPTGTTFALFQSDGATSLLDSNGNGTPDTGPLAPSASFTVVLKATLPTGATGGPFTVTKTATSKFDPTKTAAANDTLTVISNNSVDLTQNTARTDSVPAGTAAAGNTATTGFGPGTGTVIATNTVAPSATAVTTTAFRLVVNNTSGVADSFDLSTTSAIPTGYSVAFFNDGGGACATLGSGLTNTGTVGANGNKAVCAVVTVPSTSSGNAAASTNSFTFRAQSPITSTSTDSIVDAVTVLALHSVTITPNGTQTTFAGGAVIYTHVLRNTGNATETVTFATGFLTDSQSAASWTSSAYVDTNANGTYDAGTDALISTATTISLAANATQTVFVRVFAPGSATASSPADVTTITATYNAAAASTSATDTTSVTNGLLLSKAQVAGTCAAGLATGPFVTSAIAANGNTAPGKCVAYQITASNTTTGSITNVVLSDVVPSNTTLAVSSCFASTATAGATVGGTATTEGSTGTVTATLATLASSVSFNLTFCVRINP